MKRLIGISVLASTLLTAACQAPPEAEETSAPDAEAPESSSPPPPSWTFEPAMIFPADRSLVRPEDGVVLADGRLIVADQEHGLRVFEGEAHRPFGKFAEAGYQHSPPEIVGGPNGVTLEPGGTHILVSDVFRGGIYRVEVATEATERVYQHPFGVNMTRADSRGGLWFSQSTENRPEHGEEELFESVGIPNPDGALFYLPPASDGEEASPVKLAEGLLFANGLVLDEAEGLLYLSETMGNRVHRFEMDVVAGQVSGQTTALEIDHPDNIEMDRYGRLWIASPVQSEIVVFDPATGAQSSVFRISTPESEAQIELVEERLREGVSWVDLIAPPLFAPGPGPITGMVLSADGEGASYVTGLGDAIIKLGP